jgi:NAD-dependent deacetylase
MGRWDNEINRAASLLSKSAGSAAFCGSGISAESGISTFRDPGGLWDRVDPYETGTVEGLIDTLGSRADKIMPIFFELLDTFEKAEPNPGHRALADMETMGIVKTVITQNIDNLHHEAGSSNVIEVHGSLFRLRCISCDKKRSVDRRQFIRDIRKKLKALKDFSIASLLTIAPVCGACGSLMRPDVVMFGEGVQRMPEAFHSASECDILLALGTSGVVYPAAAIPQEARKRGAKVIVVNPNENAFSLISDVYIPMKTGIALPEIVSRIKEMAG